MNIEKSESLIRILTFDTADYPSWVGDVGKCSVDADALIIVGWRSEMGSSINNYRLVVKQKKNKKNNSISLVGFTDSNKPIKLKVDGISMDEALSRMLVAAENGCRSIDALARAVVDPDPQYVDS